MKLDRFPQRRLILGILIMGALFAALLLAADRAVLVDIAQSLDWRSIIPALLLTAFSYFCIGYSFALISQTIGVRMKTRPLIEVGFISNILNNVFATGGIAGYSVRYFMMSAYGVSLKVVIAVSLLHFYFISVFMMGILPVSYGYLLHAGQVPAAVTGALGLLTAFIALMLILVTLVVFSPPARAALFALAQRCLSAVSHRQEHPIMKQSNEVMTAAVHCLYANPRRLGAVIGLSFLQWAASVAVLYYCFRALGAAQPVMVVLTGFVIGLMIGVVSLVPGGFGVQEGSMAGVYAMLGVPFEQAVLVSILFRFIYYLGPYFISMTYYGSLLRQQSPSQKLE
jgi:glycosyltransferase 2 family protein